MLLLKTPAEKLIEAFFVSLREGCLGGFVVTYVGAFD